MLYEDVWYCERREMLCSVNAVACSRACLDHVEVEVVQLVAVFHDIPLDLRRVDPSHEVFHVSCDEVGSVGNLKAEA